MQGPSSKTRRSPCRSSSDRSCRGLCHPRPRWGSSPGAPSLGFAKPGPKSLLGIDLCRHRSVPRRTGVRHLGGDAIRRGEDRHQQRSTRRHRRRMESNVDRHRLGRSIRWWKRPFAPWRDRGPAGAPRDSPRSGIRDPALPTRLRTLGSRRCGWPSWCAENPRDRRTPTG